MQRLGRSEHDPTESVFRSGRGLVYAINHSLPYSTDGYALRSHGVASALASRGVPVHAYNRPGHPWDLPGFVATVPVEVHRRDGVTYLFTPEPSSAGITRDEWFERAAERLESTLRILKPGAVMAASNWENAQPALEAARRLGLPFFYEVRGFWEISRVARESAFAGSPEFDAEVAHETLTARAAERVFTLTSFMRDELVRRGVDAARIDIVPNGYAGRMQPPLGPLRRPSPDAKSFTVGFIGSFTVYEGLEDLVRACAGLRRAGVDVTLLLVGSSDPSGFVNTGLPCEVTQQLRELARELGFEPSLRTAGRVPPEALPEYYAQLDLFVIPRRPFQVCELVSPIKPLEAAAHGLAMLCSDVAPLAELAGPAGVALFRKGDWQDLQRRMGELLLDPARREQMGERARHWVEQDRPFSRIVQPMLDALDQAFAGRPARAR